MTWTTQPRSDVAGHAAIVAGQGAPIVLLHGVGLRAEAWAAQITALSQFGQVIAPDMAGHGAALMPSAIIEFDDYVARVQSLLAALPAPCVLIGHSMGAMLALEVAARTPHTVCAVAALNAVFERGAQATEAVQARANALDGESQTDPTPTLVRWFENHPSPERAACEAWLKGVDPAAYKSAYTAFAHSPHPRRASLAKIACPALFVTGSQEPNSTPDMSRAMADLTPQGRFEVIFGAAHMMPMTHPDETNAALISLVKSVRAKTAEKGV